MKKIITFILGCSILFTGCKSNKTDGFEATIEQHMDEIKSSTAEQGQAGKGKITLICNGKTFEINGVCGAVTSMGSLTIAVPDDSFPAKTFTINFTTDKLPDATSTYKITKYSIDDKDANHVTVSYTDMRSTSTMIWESDDKTGKLDFAVNDNEIKCSFSNLTLQASEFYNKGDLNAKSNSFRRINYL